MMPIEVIERCEDAYDPKKPMSLNTRQLYLDYLGRYDYTVLDALCKRTIEENRYFPRIADFHSAAKDLMIRVEKVSKPEPNSNCTDCDGTGWVYCTVETRFATVKALKPCSCHPRPKYALPADQGVTGVPF